MDLANNKIYFRHDKVRSHQDKLLNDVCESVSSKNHLLAHAPVGLGKTDAVIGASLRHALENGLTIFFLTPKISQHKIAIDVVSGIVRKYDLKLRATDLIGRRYACIDPSLSGLDHDGFYLSCEKKRKNESCEFYRNARGYSKAEEARARHLFDKLMANYGHAKAHLEMMKLGEEYFACPYEWMIKTASVSNVIIADYYHLMIPKIREIFLLKTKKKLDKSIVIIDEAHNLAKRVREHMSSTLNSFMLRRAEKEMRLVGAERVGFFDEFNKWAGGHLKNEREVLASKEMFDNFLSAYKIDEGDLADYLEAVGLEFIERTNKKSMCMKFCKFLRNWETEENGVLRVLRKRGDFFSLSKRFLDPSTVTCELNKAHSTILMSGTLLPLEMHRDVLGLDESRAVLKAYRSPFDENNAMNIIANSTTTRYSKRDFENYSRMAENIDKIINSSPDGVAIFFPSYVVLNAVVPLMKTKPEKLIVQKGKMTPCETAELIRQFGKGGVLCCVQGGSLAEGIDYSREEIKTAIIVGIALEEPTLEIQALIDHYQEKFGKGWEYGYMYPAVIKALQAAGRGIRKETDRVAVVFMDERFNWKNYRNILNSDGRKFVVTSEPEKYVKFFWSGATKKV